MNSFEKEKIASCFLSDPSFCKTKSGELIKDCDILKKEFNLEVSSPGGCSACRKKGIFSKYKNIIISRLNDL